MDVLMYEAITGFTIGREFFFKLVTMFRHELPYKR